MSLEALPIRGNRGENARLLNERSSQTGQAPIATEESENPGLAQKLLGNNPISRTIQKGYQACQINKSTCKVIGVATCIAFFVLLLAISPFLIWGNGNDDRPPQPPSNFTQFLYDVSNVTGSLIVPFVTWVPQAVQNATNQLLDTQGQLFCFNNRTLNITQQTIYEYSITYPATYNWIANEIANTFITTCTSLNAITPQSNVTKIYQHVYNATYECLANGNLTTLIKTSFPKFLSLFPADIANVIGIRDFGMFLLNLLERLRLVVGVPQFNQALTNWTCSDISQVPNAMYTIAKGPNVWIKG